MRDDDDDEREMYRWTFWYVSDINILQTPIIPVKFVAFRVTFSSIMAVISKEKREKYT